ncbi:MAG: hypothetical protein AB8B58_16070 [Roseobacter sp.]
MRLTLFALTLLASLGTTAHAASLQSILANGGSVTEGDVIFKDFVLTDQRGGGGRFPEDDMPTVDEILVTTTSTANSVTLTFDFVPEVLVSGLTAADNFTMFSFTLDLRTNIASTSTRTFQNFGVSTTSSGFAATGSGSVEVSSFALPRIVTSITTIDISTPNPTVTSASTSLNGESSLGLRSFIDGVSKSSTSSASLNQFSLTLTLDGTSPTIDVVPLPAGLPLMLSAFAIGAFALRRKKTT